MTGVEITLILVGIIFVLVSFFVQETIKQFAQERV